MAEDSANSPLYALPGACSVSDLDPLLTSREYPEPNHPYRTPFQRDRARVIHARSFRRLAGKTQVFTHRYSDHFRSRLTHTMEVAQISRTVANALHLNEDLTETLALAHDIGHPPFGHAGEQALDDAMRQFGLRFDHNLHALRIVRYFEIRYAAFRGLNLTLAVREGIVKHSREYSPEDHPELGAYFPGRRPPLEAQIIDLADEIAYVVADIDDGLESGILNIGGLQRNVTIFDRFFSQMRGEYANAEEKLLVNEALKRMLNALVGDLIRETAARVRRPGIDGIEGIRAAPERLAGFSPGMEERRLEAKRYLFTALYQSEELRQDQQESTAVVRELFQAWVHDPSLLPAAYYSQIPREAPARVAADYIAGMTDHYILRKHGEWRTR